VIVVDASVLIAHLDTHDALHGRAEQRLLDAVGEELGASPITVAEVLVGPARHDRLDDAEDALNALAIHHVPFEKDAPRQLAKLRADTGLKLPDCCVLLAAQQAEAAGVLSFDERLTRAAADLGFE
jgi:predicted nucleic acid-binding protein